jgi:hypothetical protein
MADKMYKTRVLIEVEVDHWYDPKQAVQIVTTRMMPHEVPAITSVKVLKVESNYRLFQPPADELVEVKLEGANG